MYTYKVTLADSAEGREKL